MENYDIYVLNFLSDAYLMKNYLNPHLKIKVTFDREQGYHLLVYNDSTGEVIYAFYVDYGGEDAWSLTLDETISMLNLIGFPCKWDESRDPYEMSDTAIETLKSLKSQGYNIISREVRPNCVMISSSTKVVHLNEWTTNYNYRDWLFLKARELCPIDQLLKRVGE